MGSAVKRELITLESHLVLETDTPVAGEVKKQVENNSKSSGSIKKVCE